jgi:hypothetical protein
MKKPFALILQLFLQIISSRNNLHTYGYETQNDLLRKTTYLIYRVINNNNYSVEDLDPTMLVINVSFGEGEEIPRLQTKTSIRLVPVRKAKSSRQFAGYIL